MNINDIKRRVTEISGMSFDAEAAHASEDKLLKDFVRHVAASGHDPFAAMAAEVLKSGEVAFRRGCM